MTNTICQPLQLLEEEPRCSLHYRRADQINDLLGEPEVSDLDSEPVEHQQVVRLDVSVLDAFGVNEPDALDEVADPCHRQPQRERRIRCTIIQ